jgi:hypothetical protein
VTIVAAWMGASALAGAGAAMGERSEKCDGKGGQRHLIEGARFAADSPLEGSGFELSVPPFAEWLLAI